MEANAILHDEIATLKSRKLVTHVDGKYTDRMRLCVTDILSHNVGINQVARACNSSSTEISRH